MQPFKPELLEARRVFDAGAVSIGGMTFDVNGQQLIVGGIDNAQRLGLESQTIRLEELSAGVLVAVPAEPASEGALAKTTVFLDGQPIFGAVQEEAVNTIVLTDARRPQPNVITTPVKELVFVGGTDELGDLVTIRRIFDQIQ